MARVKRAVAGRKKRQTLVERTKGYYGVHSRTFRGMKEQSQHSGQYAYRDRRNKKRDFRSLWIQRINAAARMNELSYSRLMHGLKLAGVELDRKVLAEIAYSDEQTFSEIADVAKKALADAE
ncbi:50S ribosomal protein L20 [Thermophilibacter immobilis]|jgi:large subunit ribosomal protein L20|uniref:Large ribosomal subunit protein bL20 n=1 Tax=Thermophilibacter immobilis TaxID=2779519 RepID=A0A7S7RTY2_9ACTN|nr:50S ribosomal protein L20 [Thermophilibacter immobilis]QOY60003.1 50S ribosomal protein L20 [Thermophilibacter immobilis]